MIVEIKKVFNWCWNDRSVDAETTVSGSEFQICEAATGKYINILDKLN